MGEFGFIELVWGWSPEDIDSRQDHIWERHRLTPEEIEEALLDDSPRHWVNRADQPANRRIAVGRTNGGRYLQVVVESDSNDGDVWRIITAWPASPNWVELHRRATGERNR